MTIGGFTRCDECRGSGGLVGTPGKSGLGGAVVTNHACPSCSGSGLVPTEKLREDAAHALGAVGPDQLLHVYSDAVLAKVAEHIGEGR